MFGVRRAIKKGDAKSIAVERLAMRGMDKISKKAEKKKSDISTPSDVVPKEIETFVKCINEDIVKAKSAINDGVNILKRKLETLNDDELEQVRNEFMQSKDLNYRVATEDKLMSCIDVLLPPIKKIDEMIPHLMLKRNELVEVLVKSFASSYNTMKGSELVFSGEALLGDIERIQAYRAGIKKATDFPVSQPENQVQNEPSASCPLM